MVPKINPQQLERFNEMLAKGASNNELSSQFSISVSTVERYKYPSIRELSRTVQRRRNRVKLELKNCYKCGSSVKGHPKCSVCEIILHNGLDKCDSCYYK